MTSFIKERALPNILVHFCRFTLPEPIHRSFLSSVRAAVTKIYGPDQYTVYPVTDDDLRNHSRIFTAKALLIIVRGHQQEPSTRLGQYDRLRDMPRSTLLFEELCQEQFNFDYFRSKMKTLIPPPDDQVHEMVIEKTSKQLYLFDGQEIHRKWAKFSTGLQLVQDRPPEEDQVALVTWPEDRDRCPVDQFDVAAYFAALDTRTIGRTVLFAHITGTTMEMAGKLREIYGIVATANYQTQGQGRSQNQWLSPFGCAMFTINLKFDLSDPIIGHISLLQHLASLAIVDALPSKELGLKIKWPNDILYEASRSKLAGILTQSFSYGKQIYVQIGIGINVSNRKPSICLDELITFYNLNQGKQMPLIPGAVVIARVLNQFERRLDLLYSGHLEQIQEAYCANWIHSGAIIKFHDTRERAEIVGIDQNGYLAAKDLTNGQMLTLMPNGNNRFDMMDSLAVKDRCGVSGGSRDGGDGGGK